MDPFDEISVEETLRTALAMGACRAIPLETDDAVEQLTVARILKRVAEAEQPGPIIVGKQAIDDDSNPTGQMLAALMGIAQATFASKIEIGDGKATVTRKVDGGLQTIDIKLPAVVTSDLRLNEPRYASPSNIMKAKKKPLDKKSPADFSVSTVPRLKVPETEEPSGRKAGVKVKSVAKLSGVAGVLLAESDALANNLAEPLVDLIVGLAGSDDTILSADTFKRPIYAGNPIQTVYDPGL